jgi:hypothetical protein
MRFRERHLALALVGVLLALLLVLSGCGGGEASTAASSEENLNESLEKENAPSAASKKESFVEAVDDICFRHSQEQAKQVEAYEKKHGIPVGEPTVAQQEQIIVKVILPIVRETLAELEEYEPDPSQEAKLNAFIKALDDATTFTEKNPHFLAAERGKEPFHAARGRAAAMGTYLCGQA